MTVRAPSPLGLYTSCLVTPPRAWIRCGHSFSLRRQLLYLSAQFRFVLIISLPGKPNGYERPTLQVSVSNWRNPSVGPILSSTGPSQHHCSTIAILLSFACSEDRLSARHDVPQSPCFARVCTPCFTRIHSPAFSRIRPPCFSRIWAPSFPAGAQSLGSFHWN